MRGWSAQCRGDGGHGPSRHASGANDYVVLQVDMRNAFNSISRDAVLKGCLAKVPTAYNWLRFCYGGASPLFCQGRFLCTSHVGVHQGDACWLCIGLGHRP